MKILFVNKFLHPNGGSETYIFKLGKHLIDSGHKVQYFGMEHENRCVGNNVDSYTANMDFHSGGKISKLLYPVKTIYSVEARKKIRAVLEDFSPDVVHINNFNYQLTPSIIVETKKYERKIKKKVKLIFTAHDYQLICPNHMMNNPNSFKNCEKCIDGSFINCTKEKCIHESTLKSAIGTIESYYWNARNIYKHFDAIICPSEFMKSKMDNNEVFRNKTITLHNFIDEIEKSVYQKEDYILYFGRFSREKGILTLIEACERLPKINFIFAGTGPMADKLDNIRNIKNVGFQTGKDLERLISKARLTVYTSEWYENCPFSVMESQMYGTPVLGADIGGIPELIEIGKTGELFESGNVEDLTCKIQELWSNRKSLEDYSENCKGISFDTLTEYNNKLLKIYTR